jgi:hypothetical protein
MALDAALAVKVWAVGENEGCRGHFEGLGRACERRSEVNLETGLRP